MFDAKMDQAYSWPLWGAAYVINGGCSDDTFTDFRAALISRGRQAFEAQLRIWICWRTKISMRELVLRRLSYAVTDGVEAVAGTRPQRSAPCQPSGTEWREDAVYALFPKMSGKLHRCSVADCRKLSGLSATALAPA